MVRQGVQMVDGTRRRVDLLVKCAPLLKDDDTSQQEKFDDDLLERLGRFGVDYDQYIQTLATLDIGEKYRLSEQCFELLSSMDYKRYLTVDLERIAPLHRVQPHPKISHQEDIHDAWMTNTTTTSSSSSSSVSNIKHEPIDFYGWFLCKFEIPLHICQMRSSVSSWFSSASSLRFLCFLLSTLLKLIANLDRDPAEKQKSQTGALYFTREGSENRTDGKRKKLNTKHCHIIETIACLIWFIQWTSSLLSSSCNHELQLWWHPRQALEMTLCKELLDLIMSPY